MAAREKDGYGAGIWCRQRTVDGRTCKEGRKSHLSGRKCEPVQTVGKTVQTVDNISVFGGSVWTTAGNPSEIRLDCARVC